MKRLRRPTGILTKRSRTFCVVFFVLLAVASIFYFAFNSIIDRLLSPAPWPVEKFSSENWKSLQSEERFIFCRDLIGSKALDSLRKADVIALLGQPDYVPPGEGYYSYTVKGRGRYEVSMNSIYFMTIYFDAHGVVARYEIGAD